MNIIRLMASAAVLAGALASATAQEIVLNEKPAIDASDGLKINGESIGDRELLAKAKAEGTIMLYTGASEETERQYATQFERDTGIKVEILRLVPARLTERILSEHGAGKLATDVIRSTEPGLFGNMARAGVFTPYSVPFEATLHPAAKASADGLFYLWSSPVYTVGYNAAVIPADQAPKSWKDLLNPRLKGKLGIVQAGAGGSTTALTRFMFDKLGEDWVKGYAGQSPRIFDVSARLLDSMARGEIIAGPVPPSRVNVIAAGGAPLKFIIPTDGMVVWQSYIALPKAASKPNAAKLFINWTMSKYGQGLVVKLGDYPVRTDAGTPNIMGTQMPPLDSIYQVTVEQTVSHDAADQKAWNAIFGYTPR